MMAKQCSQVLPIDWDKVVSVMGNKKKGAHMGFPDGSVVKITPANAGDAD